MTTRLQKAILGLAACAALTLAPAARADLIPSGWAAGPQSLRLSIGGTPPAGAMQGTFDGTPVVFWCVELTQFFHFGVTYTNYSASESTNTLLSKLFTAAYGSALSSATNAAAFQLAVWEIVYDSSNLQLTGGGFKVLNNNGYGATVTLAQSWLDALASTSADYSLFYLRSPDNQDFITASRVPGTEVPEPGTALLLLAALLAAVGLRAYRRSPRRH